MYPTRLIKTQKMIVRVLDEKMRILVICLKICHLDSLSGARVCLTTMNGSMILVSKRDNMMPECRIRAGGEGPIEKSYFDRCKAFEPSLKILFLEEKKKHERTWLCNLYDLPSHLPSQLCRADQLLRLRNLTFLVRMAPPMPIASPNHCLNRALLEEADSRTHDKVTECDRLLLNLESLTSPKAQAQAGWAKVS